MINYKNISRIIRNTWRFVAGITLGFFIVVPAYAAPSDLDTTFGTAGIVTTEVAPNVSIAYAVTLQSDGKIVAAGMSAPGGDTNFALARYRTDGTLDTTFGVNGKVNTPIGSSFEEIYAVAIQSDGKIVAAGRSWNGTFYDFALARYDADGSLDATFGSGGKVITILGTAWSQAFAIVIQADGKIVIGGQATIAGSDDFALVRYNANGSLDGTFGTGGKVTTFISANADVINGLAIQSDNKIIAAGYANFGGNTDFALARYNPNGSLDTSFGTGGIVTTAVGSGHDVANDVAIQGDGKIVAAGYSISGSNREFALVRYNINGALDAGFGAGGRVLTAIVAGDDEINGIGIQSNGKIVAAGYAVSGGKEDFAVARYSSDGMLDTAFGTSGAVITAVGTDNDRGQAMALQPDGKIVVAGFVLDGAKNFFALTRYEGDPISFGTVGSGSGGGGGGDTNFNGLLLLILAMAVAGGAGGSEPLWLLLGAALLLLRRRH